MSTPLHDQDASTLLARMATGELGSRELLECYLERIGRHNASINAVVAMDVGRARREADAADAARQRGDALGPLHGLPMTIKDCYEVPGMACTAGSPEFKHHVPAAPAIVVRQLQDAGAIVFGKTNVPYMAGDIQTYNPVFGTTNNPWNSALTCGGSSGGSAAALAAGFTALEFGSDIGGSIRTPSHFCGVYGHKPSHGIISMQGHIPGPPGELTEPELAVAGPMARSATDLALLLEVTGAAPPAMADGWQLNLPRAPQKSLSDFRVLMWMDDPGCPLDSRLSAVYTQLQSSLVKAGASVTRGSPDNLSLERFFAEYAVQITAQFLAWPPAATPTVMRHLMSMGGSLTSLLPLPGLPPHADKFAKGAAISHANWLAAREAGLHLRAEFLKVFGKYDVILTPPVMTTAFRHDHSRFFSLRKVTVDGKRRSYTDMLMWQAPPVLMGLPATSAPVGLTHDHLPVNVQIIGAPYHDLHTLKFAELMAAVTGGFRAPPPISR
ncbi:MAG: amidase [Moraxellaceae bacterium]|nr:amidase [Moraxellaceae bacterium]